MTTLAHQTRIAIRVVEEDDSGQVAQFLTALTSLIGLLLAIATWLKPVVIWTVDFFEAVDFTVKVFSIGVNSLAYGLGVRI